MDAAVLRTARLTLSGLHFWTMPHHQLWPCWLWARGRENLLLHHRYLRWIFWVPFHKHIYLGFIPARPSRTRCSFIQLSQHCYSPSYSGKKSFFLCPLLFDAVSDSRISLDCLPKIVEVPSSSWCPRTGFPSLLLTPLHLGRAAALPANEALFNSIKMVYSVMRLTKYFGWLRLWVRNTHRCQVRAECCQRPSNLYFWHLKLYPPGLHPDRKGRSLCIELFRNVSFSFNGQA